MLTENNFCLNEINYKKIMDEKVLPFISQYEQSGYFKGTDGVNLFYRKFELENTKANTIIIHGFTEHTQRYNEFIYYLLKNNYSVYIYDQRCHGLSDRLCDKYNMVYVKDFCDYVNDLKIFLENIVSKQKTFLYGHSMGGAAVAYFLEENPNDVDFAILSAPMLQIATKHVSSQEIDLYLKTDLETDSNTDKKYCPGQNDFDIESRLKNPEYKDYPKYIYAANFDIEHPNLVTSGASFGWFKQSLRAIKKIMSEESLDKIKTPITLFQHGRDETVLPDNQNKFVARVKNCELYKIDEAKHSIRYMPNNITASYFKKVIDLFDSH